MKNKMKITSRLMSRIFQDISENNVKSNVSIDEPLTTPEEIAKYVKQHLHDFISEEEQLQLLTEQHNTTIYDEIDNLSIILSQELLAHYLNIKMKKYFKEYQKGDSEVLSQISPESFNLSKCNKEQLGVKFQDIDETKEFPSLN